MTAEAAATFIGDLLKRSPTQFGMRGDPRLWQELQSEVAESPLPDDWFDLRRLIETAIERRIGQAPSEFADLPSVHVAEFDPGHGTSAGHVRLRWWAHTGIPIILDRFEGVRRTPDAAEL